MHAQLRFQMAIQSKRYFSGAKFNSTSKNDWELLFRVNLEKEFHSDPRNPHQLSPQKLRARNLIVK